MSQSGAEIIAFPGARRREAPQDARLSAALAELHAALEVQRDAIAAWRGSIEELGGATRSIEASLDRYRSRLGALQTGLISLHQQSSKLRDWGETHGHATPG
ncbi:MAG: hypothetical protein J0H14_03455 [Alphaproteobacteria bacterium]|nr:hypothetical protein [Alphaproteobacteria bacterium]